MSTAVRARRFAAIVVVAMIATLLAPVGAGAVPPPAPTGLSPNGTVESANPTFSWATVPAATRYRIQVSTDPTFGTTLVNTLTYNTSYAPPTELPTGTLYWRVQALTGAETGPYASTSFTKSLAGVTQLAPADGAVLTFPTDSPTFEWTSSDAAKSYVLEIDDAADFIGATKVVTAATRHTLVNTQDYGQTFFWRVRGSSNTSGTGVLTPWSSTRTYSTIWPDVPSLQSPPNTTLTSITDVCFDWSDVVGADSYELEVSISIDFNGTPVLRKTGLKHSMYVDPDHFDNGSYFWRVRAYDVDGHVGGWSTVYAFTRGWPYDPAPGPPRPGCASYSGPTLDPAPGGNGGPTGIQVPGSADGSIGAGPAAPGAQCTSPDLSLLFPADGGIMPTPAHFAWCPTYRSARYEVQVDDDPGFTSPAVCYTIQTEVYAYTGGSSSAGSCAQGMFTTPIGVEQHWRVRGIDDDTGQIGLWSASRSFTRAETFTTNELTALSPIGGATVAVPTLSWSTVPGAGEYDVQIRDAALALLASTTTSATSWTPDVVLPSGVPLTWSVAWGDAELSGGTFMVGGAITTFLQPDPIAPSDGAESHLPPSLSWQWTTGAASYTVSVIEDATASEIYNVSGLPYPAWTPPDTLEAGSYTWQVQALDVSDVVIATGLARTFDILPIALQQSDYDAPALCSPPAPCEQFTSSPHLTWSAVPGVTRYQVYFAFDEFFTNIDRTYIVPGNVFIPREELPDNNVGQAYYWYVRPCRPDPSGVGEECSPHPTGLSLPNGSFQKRSVPVDLVSPTDASTSTDEPLFVWGDYLKTLWPDDLEARDYRIEISTSPSMTPLLDTATVETTYFTPTTKTYPEGPLYWRVRAYDKSSNPLTWSPVWLTTKAAPSLVRNAPTDGSNVAGIPTFDWDPQVGAVDYVLEIYRNGDLTFSPANKELTATTSATEFTPLDPLAPGTYAWRLMRKDADNRDGPWTTGWTFTVDSAAPTLVSPADGALFITNDITFTWAMTPDAAAYRFQRSSAPDFSSIPENVTTTMTSWSPTAVYSDGFWYWRVQALDADNNVMGTSAVRMIERDTQVPPDAPTSVVAVAGDSEASVSWSAPSDDGGTPITGYTVTSSPGGFTCSTATLGCTVTGLTNGVTYTFTVVATNIRGDSPPSSPSNAVTPSVAPTAPLNVVAVGGNTSADVSWDAPASDGGLPITGYTVTSSPGGFTCSTAPSGAPSPASPTG